MKSPVRALAVTIGIAAGLFCGAGAFAQTTAPAAKASAPLAATAATVVAAPVASKAPAIAPAAPAAAATAAPANKAPAAMAPGGGNGKVWVNTKSKVYHCEGTKPYGTTKVGEYMSEADAKAKGNHGVKGQSCSK